jgi:hypothetical protein
LQRSFYRIRFWYSREQRSVRWFYCVWQSWKRDYERPKMLIAALIFVISIATVIQFAVLSWRAGLLRVASDKVAAEWEPLTQSGAKSVISNDFIDITAYSKLCPDLGAGSAPHFRSLRLYYRFLQLLERFAPKLIPQALSWADREMALCTRCAAVMLSRHLERTHALSVAARSI